MTRVVDGAKVYALTAARMLGARLSNAPGS
jgi:hypothetical protein